MKGLSAAAADRVSSAYRSHCSRFASIPSTHFSASSLDEDASSRIESSRFRASRGTKTFSSKCPCMPPIAIAWSLPITCAATWVTTSGITGLTFPGMIELPFCSSGRKISASPARGPEPMKRRSLAIFVSETAAVARRLRLEGVCRTADLQARLGAQLLAHACCELGVRVQARADGGAAERNLAEPRQRIAHALDPLPHLRRVAGELLAERHGDRVHPVRPPGLDHVVELLRLCLERGGELVEGGEQVVRDLAERGQMHSRGEDVVRRLPHVHVVVRVDIVAGKRGDHLVGVRVRRRSGPGLEDVDRKLVVEL